MYMVFTIQINTHALIIHIFIEVKCIFFFTNTHWTEVHFSKNHLFWVEHHLFLDPHDPILSI